MAEDKEKTKVSKNVSGIIENVEKLTVMELAELVKALEDKFGVSATPVVTGVAASAGGTVADATPAEEKTAFNVVIAGIGDQKIQVIKAVRTIRTDLGLADAKKLVESAPAVVLENAKKEDADEAKKKLEEAGAKVELK